MAKSASERRAHARFRRSFEIEGGRSGKSGAVARMTASDLSLGGLYCSSSEDYPEMTRLAVRLLLPSGSGRIDPLEAEAVVVRRKKLKSSTGNGRFELGLFFTRMDDAEREKLARYLAQT